MTPPVKIVKQFDGFSNEVNIPLGTVEVTDEEFRIRLLDGSTIFLAPLDGLVYQLCLTEPRLGNYIYAQVGEPEG